ncbi:MULTISPECIES: phosphoribosyltransferase family protein [Roseivirga]|jgi:pyrimidine operon attenuation protein/uracil phosphoribosyltransferase|uniref:Phosphoribosyltransferase n=1 Tax=Roseivirga thermotolerans TaxID=1758176 RepID=A0ABQ3I0A2_9BACT|nr:MULTISPECIES: phosphoribosyltransferase family protein [Roseivirga]MEC7755710.1 phosphoribosyltransferase family protein [Bacteroidota bacterium]GHE51524.1 phosphoribosyltransferase [Roseivirga thermotolerans]|tara:strand:+ start:3544 stop:4047 length:504 start_codon:yes stop_codon:yes gene_type:complete
MQTTEKRILEKAQIEQIIRRMAYEIYEQNYDASKIFLAGIDNNGVKISEMLAREVRAISEIPVELIRIDIDKEAQSQPTVSFSKEPDVPNFTLIVVDDVLNSGRTMIYALDPFLKMKVRKIQTAVLVNRSHKRFPIAVDYKGFELGTTIEEHIHVQLTDEDYSAYLY